MLADVLHAPVRGERGAGARLREALSALAGHFGQILSHNEKSWASITFAGTRHRLVLEFVGEAGIAAGERFIVFLPEHEFTLPGQLVADATVIAVDHALFPEPRLSVTIELLLLDEH